MTSPATNIISFSDSVPVKLRDAIEDALLGEARAATFDAPPIDPLGLVLKPSCDAAGNWSFLPFERFTDPKGARADRRITETGETL